MTQAQALDILKTGGNVFLTGEPGSGKTFVLNQYIDWLEAAGISVAVTASTGIAATHVGGMTIHSWSGIGARDELSAFELERITTREKVSKRIRKAKVLVIDEISMLDGRMLDMVDRVCRTVRQREEPFGGLQVVLVGDFFQLPPIARQGDMARFAFQSNVWKAAQLLPCYLTEQFRQEDELFLSLLSSIRKGEIEDEHYTLLSEQKDIGYEQIDPTKLFTHNKDVDTMNTSELGRLQTERASYTMQAKGPKQLLEGLVKNCLSPQTLELKLEAMVMCTKNNFEAGFVNGTLARVVEFDRDDGYPVIETSAGKRIKMTPMPWTVEEDGKVLAEVTQVPLRLAWAITVHKSQGMSLDAAEIDLRNAFTYGQGYVALSRVRSLAGMKILGLNANSLLVDPRIIAFDAQLKEESEDVETTFNELEEAELTKMHERFITACGGSLKGDKKKETRNTSGQGSTYAATKLLLDKGMNVRQIAKERGMALSTIWGHIETLAEQKALTKEHIDTLIPNGIDWEETYAELKAAMDTEGVAKLKPIYEATGERHDYDLVRLARLQYRLS